MTRRFGKLGLLIVLLALPAFAQFTTVSGTVIDPNGLPYANATIASQIVASNTPKFTATGQPYIQPTQATGLDLTGHFVVTLADNTQLTPGGTTWTFTVCSAGGTIQPAGGKGPVCFTLSGVTISGSSQNISTQLNAVAVALGSASSGGFIGAVFANATLTVQQAMTQAAGGLAIVPTTYAGGDIPNGSRIQVLLYPIISAQPAHTELFDYRFGGTSDAIFNPGFDGLTNLQFARETITNYSSVLLDSINPNNAFAHAYQTNFLNGTQNWNANGYSNKTNVGSIYSQTNVWSPAQTNANSFGAYCYAPGDCIGFTGGGISWGGTNAAADEGIHAFNASASQGYIDYIGTITSGGATGSTSLTINPSQGNGTQGQARALIDTTLGYTTGTITSQSGTGLVTVVGSGTAWTASTNTTTSAAITVVSGLTPGSVNIQVASSAGFATNNIIVIADTLSYETTKITAVPDGTHITAVFAQPHSSGSTVANASTAGTQAGNGFQFDADVWTTTGQQGYQFVTQPIRQIWPVVSVTDATHLTILISGGQGDIYVGNSGFPGAAYHLYPMAFTTDVTNAGPTLSNTLTLMPNNAAWVNTNTVELAQGPVVKMTVENIQMNRFFPSESLSASGGGITYNGIWNNSDCFWCLALNTPMTLYTGHGGHLQVPLAAYAGRTGLVRYGMFFDNMPDTTLLSVGCPVNTSGVNDCTTNSWFKGSVLIAGGNGGNDYLLHNPGLDQWAFNSGGGFNNWLVLPKISGTSVVTTGAADISVEVGYVSCTQANCASSATTLYTSPAADSIYRADAAVGCSTATATATATVTITYTDVGNHSETITSGTATCTTLGTNSTAQLSQTFMAKASTVIQYNTTTANAPAGYAARVAIYQESTN